MSHTVKKFATDDAVYAYKVIGEGPPVVLLHGFTGSKATWSTIASTWKNDFQLIAIDLPGHGESMHQSSRTMEECCHDLEKIFNHLQLGKIHLVGYSMGGRVALSFANLYPERIRSLSLESTSPGIESYKERQERASNDERLARRIEKEGIKKFVDFWEEISLFASQKVMEKSCREAVRRERMAQSEDGLSMSLRSMGTGGQPPLWGRLSTLDLPVLLLVGELDEKFITINQQMKMKLPKAEISIVKNAGHAIHVEKPEKFGKLVKTFILNHSLE